MWGNLCLLILKKAVIHDKANRCVRLAPDKHTCMALLRYYIYYKRRIQTQIKALFFLLSNLGWNFPTTFWNLNETTKTSKFCLLDYRSSMRLHDLFMMMGALFDLLKSSWKLQLKYMPIKLSLLSLFSLKVFYHFNQSKFTNLWITNLTIWTSAGFEIFQVGFFQAQSALSGNDYTHSSKHDPCIHTGNQSVFPYLIGNFA